MERKQASDFDPELLGSLFDKTRAPGIIDRAWVPQWRDKVRCRSGRPRLAKQSQALSPKFAEAQQVPKDDKRLAADYVDYESPQGNGKMRAYLARPKDAAGKKLPGVLVVHENRGLNPHIEDIARRLALDGFMAFAPDALTPLGGYPGDEDKARELFPKLDQAKTREDFVTALSVLKVSAPDCTGKVGVVGFCYGGGIANMLATRVPGPRRRRALLWRPGEGGGRAQHQGPALASLRRERRA